MAQLAPRGMVIAIEPSPTAFKCLQENVRISGHTNIVCVSCAIGTEEGSANFVDSSAYGYLSDEGSTKVELRTLASIVDQLSLHRIDFVKIDVEGTEDRILKHSFDLTNSFGSLLMFEMNTWCMLAFYNANPRSFLEWTLRSYAHILMVCPVGSDLLRKVAPSDLLPTLHTHLIEQRCITDFLVTNDGTRLLTPAQGLEVEVRSALT